jgi:hypothetical protein
MSPKVEGLAEGYVVILSGEVVSTLNVVLVV